MSILHSMQNTVTSSPDSGQSLLTSPVPDSSSADSPRPVTNYSCFFTPNLFSDEFPTLDLFCLSATMKAAILSPSGLLPAGFIVCLYYQFFCNPDTISLNVLKYVCPTVVDNIKILLYVEYYFKNIISDKILK